MTTARWLFLLVDWMGFVVAAAWLAFGVVLFVLGIVRIIREVTR